MKFTALENAAKKGGLDLNNFFFDAEIDPNTVSEWKNQNRVPTYVAPMFYSYAEAELKKRGDLADAKEVHFLSQAAKKGYEIRNGKIMIPSPGAKEVITIPEEFAHLVAYQL